MNTNMKKPKTDKTVLAIKAVEFMDERKEESCSSVASKFGIKRHIVERARLIKDTAPKLYEAIKSDILSISYANIIRQFPQDQWQKYIDDPYCDGGTTSMECKLRGTVRKYSGVLGQKKKRCIDSITFSKDEVIELCEGIMQIDNSNIPGGVNRTSMVVGVTKCKNIICKKLGVSKFENLMINQEEENV